MKQERSDSLKLKQLLCVHIWDILYKPSRGKAIQKCYKCQKTKLKKVVDKNISHRTYCWCPYCGYDLVRDSYVSENSEGLVLYKCNNCKRNSKWHFGITIIPILLED